MDDAWDRREPHPPPGDGDDFVLDGISFKVGLGADRRMTDEDGIVLRKGWPFVLGELELLHGIDARRMLEFGVAQGGSAALWPLVLPLERYVGIDLRSVEIPFPKDVVQHPRWSCVRLFGGVSQDDRRAVGHIIDTEFDGPLDVVLDDASHDFMPSQGSFEIAFPRLRPGGAYIVEDWGWTHKPGFQPPNGAWPGRPSFTNLAVQLLMLCASRPDIVPYVHVTPLVLVVSRGDASLGQGFRIDESIVNRGRPLTLIG
jgi:hypothetical protein